MSTEDGGPVGGKPLTDEIMTGAVAPGVMSLRAYAAIHLRVPNSGIDWLDEMIREANAVREAEKTGLTREAVDAFLNAPFPSVSPQVTGQDFFEAVEAAKTAWKNPPEPAERPDNYIHLDAAPDYLDGQWHDWHGGECPVWGAAVICEGRDGRIAHESLANNLYWDHKGFSTDIIRFRVVKP